MKNINVVVIPYRDRYFLRRYGNAVRDLHIIQALANDDSVSSVTVINRPVTLHERLLGLKRIRQGSESHPEFPGVRWLTFGNFDLLGPLRKRQWLEHCHDRIAGNISALKRPGHFNLLLDFSPISQIDYRTLNFDVVWYDSIDNFSKHNRFSSKERALVSNKYASVTELADFVTAVSPGAIAPFERASKTTVVPNGLPTGDRKVPAAPAPDAHDFGFMGFVTDKFDIDLARHLASRGFTIAIHGEIYDKEVGAELARIAGVTLYGQFEHGALEWVCSTFKVGLIPYLKSKLHDESPLKLYQYLSRGRPVLCSVQYEVTSEFVKVYAESHDPKLSRIAAELLAHASSAKSRNSMASSIDDGAQWKSKIAKLLDYVRTLQARR